MLIHIISEADAQIQQQQQGGARREKGEGQMKIAR